MIAFRVLRSFLKQTYQVVFDKSVRYEMNLISAHKNNFKLVPNVFFLDVKSNVKFGAGVILNK